MRSMILFCSLLSISPAFAHDGKHDDASNKSATKPPAAAAKNKLVGEVVDLTCYLSHDGQGAKHAKCALDCVKKGNPVAILANGVLYAVISSDHEPPNARLAPFVGKQVVVSGEQSAKNGLHFVDMDSVVAQDNAASEGQH